MIFTIRIATVLMLLCVACATSPAPTSPSPSTSSTRNAFNATLDCNTCLQNESPCPSACNRKPKCIPDLQACVDPNKSPGSSNTCCDGLVCVKPNIPGFVGNRCERLQAGGGELRSPGKAFDNQLCGSCLQSGLKCSAGCPKRCLPNWWICSGPKKPSGFSNTCCNGWRCVQPKNPNLRSKRCEPKPTPKPSCIKKWHHCNGSVGCCGGWRCIRPNNAPNFRGRRCEPPAKIDGCVPNWWHCRGPKNRFTTSTCCDGWRCKRVNRNGFNGHRCEPR